MAHITINQYLQQVQEAIETRDGTFCAELVSFKHPHVANPRLQLPSPEEKCQQVLESPYDEMFAAHLRCTYAVANHDFVEAYKCQTVIVQSFLRAFQAHKEENWALPIMYSVALDLRIFANNADQQLVKKGKSKVGDMLEKAAELLMGCFRVCASDTRAGIEDSKKWGMLFLVNQLFKIYFKINKLHLCKPLIRAIDSSNLKEEYSMAQRVTYKYYVGRKAMFDSDFKQAEEYLSFAFEHCHRSSQKNKRMILIYLLPVKMLLQSASLLISCTQKPGKVWIHWKQNLSASFTWWKKEGCASRWLRTVERGLLQLQPAFGFFICTSYIFPFKACQKGHEAEHFGSEKSVKTCYYLITSCFY
ncbi:PCI domain-containing protein 2 isoform X3 [Pyrgilauda ruficollis]|uniref:PCI domain-containing protein 2 isoform X3 n=1 Tax=Pyrgilauda ruficollis TaxID=221976 RepID=UPI001B87083F|nr:PCI domain-containing protein 2 isoform X3 [Pyrgilauda ruficollis]